MFNERYTVHLLRCKQLKFCFEMDVQLHSSDYTANLLVDDRSLSMKTDGAKAECCVHSDNTNPIATLLLALVLVFTYSDVFPGSLFYLVCALMMLEGSVGAQCTHRSLKGKLPGLLTSLFGGENSFTLFSASCFYQIA